MADLRRALRRRRAAELTVEPLVDVVSEFGTVVGDSVGKDYRVNNSRVEKFLKSYMIERVDMINATTRDALQKALQSDDPRQAVRDVFRRARESRARADCRYRGSSQLELCGNRCWKMGGGTLG